MKREDLLVESLQELRIGHSVQDVASRLPSRDREDLESLLHISVKLTELPQNIELASTSKARLRAQLMSQITKPAPRNIFVATLDSVRDFFSLSAIRPMLMRPMGAALSAFLALGLAGGSTVSAAMDTIPGDGLYPVKTTVELARLSISVTPEDKAQTYLWMANSRVGELSRLVAVGRIDETTKVISDYEYSVQEALRIAAEQKTADISVREQFAAVETSLKEAYDKAPASVQEVMVQKVATIARETATTMQSTTSAPATGEVSGDAKTITTTPATETMTAAALPEETPITTGLPSTPILPVDKGVTAGGPTAGSEKGSPLSSPPAPTQPDPIPGKGTVGPEPKPVVTSDTPVATTEPVQGTDTGKDQPVDSTEDDALPTKTLNGETKPDPLGDSGTKTLNGTETKGSPLSVQTGSIGFGR